VGRAAATTFVAMDERDLVERSAAVIGRVTAIRSGGRRDGRGIDVRLAAARWFCSARSRGMSCCCAGGMARGHGEHVRRAAVPDRGKRPW
jgi:hypothetical protein